MKTSLVVTIFFAVLLGVGALSYINVYTQPAPSHACLVSSNTQLAESRGYTCFTVGFPTSDVEGVRSGESNGQWLPLGLVIDSLFWFVLNFLGIALLNLGIFLVKKFVIGENKQPLNANQLSQPIFLQRETVYILLSGIAIAGLFFALASRGLALEAWIYVNLFFKIISFLLSFLVVWHTKSWILTKKLRGNSLPIEFVSVFIIQYIFSVIGGSAGFFSFPVVQIGIITLALLLISRLIMYIMQYAFRSHNLLIVFAALILDFLMAALFIGAAYFFSVLPSLVL